MHMARSRRRIVPLLLAAITLPCLCSLLIWDVRPKLFPPNAHALLSAFPLVMIAFAWLAHHAAQRGSPRDWLKAALLAAAFLFWATNQCLRDPRAATVCNDIAIALFVLDLLCIIAAPFVIPEL
jgi:hypothetical protein